MVLDADNVRVRFVNFFWGRYPKSRCSFFWAYIFAIISLPLTWFPLLSQKFLSKRDSFSDVEGPFSLIVASVSFLLTATIMFATTESGTKTYLGALIDSLNWPLPIDFIVFTPLVSIAVAIFLVLIIGLAFAVVYCSSCTVQKIEKLTNIKLNVMKDNVFIDYIKAKKRKHCPLITYKYKDKLTNQEIEYTHYEGY